MEPGPHRPAGDAEGTGTAQGAACGSAPTGTLSTRVLPGQTLCAGGDAGPAHRLTRTVSSSSAPARARRSRRHARCRA